MHKATMAAANQTAFGSGLEPCTRCVRLRRVTPGPPTTHGHTARDAGTLYEIRSATKSSGSKARSLSRSSVACSRSAIAGCVEALAGLAAGSRPLSPNPAWRAGDDPGRRIVEVPVTHRPRQHGTSSLRLVKLVSLSVRALADGGVSRAAREGRRARHARRRGVHRLGRAGDRLLLRRARSVVPGASVRLTRGGEIDVAEASVTGAGARVQPTTASV